MTRFRSEPLRYGSFLVYAPRPKNRAERAAKRYVIGPYKQDGLFPTDPPVGAVHYLANRLANEIKAGRAEPLASFFPPEAVLVPIPRHHAERPGRKRKADVVWAPHSLATALCEQGMGRSVELLLSRRSPVRKSAGATRRPSPEEHYGSFAVVDQVPIEPLTRIVLVDDVVTRGSTFLGAAWRLQEVFPEAELTAFAGVRTMSAGFGTEMIQPVTGMIDPTPARNP